MMMALRVELMNVAYLEGEEEEQSIKELKNAAR